MLFNLFQRADYWLHHQVIENRQFQEITEWESTLKNVKSWGLKIRVSVVRFRDWPPNIQALSPASPVGLFAF